MGRGRKRRILAEPCNAVPPNQKLCRTDADILPAVGKAETRSACERLKRNPAQPYAVQTRRGAKGKIRMWASFVAAR